MSVDVARMEEKKPARKDNAVYVVGLPVDNNEEIVQGALEKLMGKVGVGVGVGVYWGACGWMGGGLG